MRGSETVDIRWMVILEDEVFDDALMTQRAARLMMPTEIGYLLPLTQITSYVEKYIDPTIDDVIMMSPLPKLWYTSHQWY